MTRNIQEMRDYFITRREHHALRHKTEGKFTRAQEWEAQDTPPARRAVLRLCLMLEREKPVVFPWEKIACLRTIPQVPSLFTQAELARLREEHWIHETGEVSNINVDYTRLLGVGVAAKKLEVEEAMERVRGDKDKQSFLSGLLEILDAITGFAERYRKEAEACGNPTVADTLSRVPDQPPQTFLEALQFLRIIHFAMWCAGNYHNTLGRLDQYLYPYLRADLDSGRLDEESALELLEEFFLTFNRDSDLYPGMQQGDNGQSVVLGGRNPDGSDSYNLLSELCLRASLELKLIDPKINLRVHKDTPPRVYYLGTQLTKQGLGFPQYANDDVVIPGLEALDYSSEDAANYAVAACWEFIIPGRAMDIPNIGAVSFAQAVVDAIPHLEGCGSYEEFLQQVKSGVEAQVEDLCEAVKRLYLFPAPMLSLMMESCVENARDISQGCVYNNYGFHGTGLSTAADSLACVKRFVFEEQSVEKGRLVRALESGFADEEALRGTLRLQGPKMGNDDDYVDGIAVELLNHFADSLEGRTNERGGVIRPGTGSAMYYLWHGQELPATPDGRDPGEGLAANYSPSLFTRSKGPVSIIRSFVKPDLKRVVNGGPLTLELHDSVFRTEEAVGKTSLLVKSFVDLGGHQLQLNAVNRDQLRDAQKHPENHRNLIVRVWGWSGYFVELDREYQDHIISRMELVT